MNIFSRLRAYNEKHPRIVNAVLTIASLTFFLLLLEWGFRSFLLIFQPEAAAVIRQFSQSAAKDDTLRRFEPHPYLAYAPSKIRFEKEGVRIGQAFYPRRKNPHVMRIACLGGSTTMNQFPDPLARLLMQESGPLRFEVMDFGCDAWTLMETTINYLIRVSALKPDIAIVHHGCNDVPPRYWPNYLPDYSHFRKTWQEAQIPSSIKYLLTRSWLGCFLMQRLGLTYYDITNLTVHRIPPSQMKNQYADEALETYEKNLRMLAALTKVHGGTLIIAPMAYSRTKAAEKFAQGIEDYNRISRETAADLNLPIAETDSILKNHDEWFTDQVHLNSNGNALKAQIFAKVIREIVDENNTKTPAEVASNEKKTLTEKRDLELRWEYDPHNIREYHVYVRIDHDPILKYLGRTFPGTSQSYRWKADAPELAPIMKEEFHSGPRMGHTYYFQVYPITQDDPPKVLKPLKSGLDVNIIERPWE
ncbi:MAG: SGNH/GDSL hydrolase family protein [Candidatus Hinthialibacter sp.]